jgi:uroporphyrinogen decarboxylase
MLTALSGGKPETIPCSFMLFNGLKTESRDYLDFIQRQLDLGLDPYVQIPPRPIVVKNDHYNLHGLPVSYHPSVAVKEWKEAQPGQHYPILVKEYHTPAGVLRAEVRQDDEWRWGDHVPFLDDYLVGRSNKFIVDGPEDLDALRYLLMPPTPAEIEAFKAESAPAVAFARQHDLLLAGGWGVGADLIGWVYGLHRLPFAVFDHPDFITELLEIIASWNHSRMEAILQQGVDLFIKRAWYENCDNFIPRHYRQFIRPILERDAALAHQYGAKFAFMMTSNCMPLLDDFRDAGVDVVIGVDPAHWDLEVAQQKLGGKVCLWGGVNGHLTVELGKPGDVRLEVQRAIDVFGPGGGFILSPVDNVREYTPTARSNVAALVDAWKEFR